MSTNLLGHCQLAVKHYEHSTILVATNLLLNIAPVDHATHQANARLTQKGLIMPQAVCA